VRLGTPRGEARFESAIADLRGVRVLVVESDPRMREGLVTRLRSWGAEVEEADSGGQALEMVRAEATRFHAILLAARMRGLGGFEVAHHLHGIPGVVARTVLILPIDYRQGDPARARSLGLAGSVVHPVYDDELAGAIAAARGEARAGTFPAAVAANRRRRILLADDSEEIRMIVERLLHQDDVTVDFATDGTEAVAKFREAAYDLVLMDMEMPRLDGRRATAQIRAWELENARDPTPIVGLSAHAMETEIRESLAAGCTAYLSKPFTRRQLLEVIHSYGRDA
jgi:CheY-like chemotaxis protein